MHFTAALAACVMVAGADTAASLKEGLLFESPAADLQRSRSDENGARAADSDQSVALFESPTAPGPRGAGRSIASRAPHGYQDTTLERGDEMTKVRTA